MYNRIPFIVSVCLLIFFTTTVKSMVMVEPKEAVSATKHTKVDDKNAAPTKSSKDVKTAKSQAESEVIIRQSGNVLIFTAPQPKTKMCATNQDFPDPEMLNNADIRQWYEIDDGDDEAPPYNKVLWNLVDTTKNYFEQSIFPRFKNKMHKILVAFDIDETALTYYEFYYKFYTTPHSENEYYALLEATRNYGANQPILSLYNFLKSTAAPSFLLQVVHHQQHSATATTGLTSNHSFEMGL